VFGNWESGPAFEQENGAAVVTGVQVGVTLASLVNGGWRITPYVVDSVYDHKTAKRYYRSGEATEKRHVLDPALGVKIRRELLLPWLMEQENVISFHNERLELRREQQWSRYSFQELFTGLAPAKQPKYLLMMAVERDELPPTTIDSGKQNSALDKLGREMLAAFQREEHLASDAEQPPGKSKENRNQFFISKRLNRHDSPGKVNEPVALMPSLKGLSLRRGLQRLYQYNFTIRVKGSGRIVAQYPIPGAPLTGVGECLLTLKTD
jgi:cell division protein FtsI (penicillin-binding protein 3)